MEDGNDAGQQGGSGNTGASGDSGNQGQKEPKTFTQEQLDAIIQERLAKPKQQLVEAQKLLDQFKSNKSLTDEQSQQLQLQVDTLQKQILSKEELSAKEKKELQDQLNNRLKQVEEDAKKWRNLYESNTVQRSIYDEVRDDAFDPQQLIDLLTPKTKLIEETVDGKSTGRLLPVISFEGRDKDGKTVKMELSPADTVKEMKKMTDKYGNLFKSGLNSGIGGKNDGGTGGELTEESVSQMSHEDYLKHRAKIKEMKSNG